MIYEKNQELLKQKIHICGQNLITDYKLAKKAAGRKKRSQKKQGSC